MGTILYTVILSIYREKSRQNAKRVWAYLKEHKLQDADNKQYFTPDAKMKPIFERRKLGLLEWPSSLRLTLPTLEGVKKTFVGRSIHHHHHHRYSFISPSLIIRLCGMCVIYISLNVSSNSTKDNLSSI